MNWDYLVLTSGTDGGDLEHDCLIAGQEGWELVTLFVVEAIRDVVRTRLIFKRPA